MNNIKKFIDKEDTIRIITWVDNNHYYIRVSQYKAHTCATRTNGEYAVEYWWDSYVKDFTDKIYANNYFNKIKRINNTLRAVSLSTKDHKIVTDYMKDVERYEAKKVNNTTPYDNEASNAWEKANKEREDFENYIDNMKF